MKVLLATATSLDIRSTGIPEWRELVSKDRFGVHKLTDSPDEADLILFIDPHQHPNDWRLRAIRQHPHSQKYPEKAMVYDERDHTWCSLPGIYVSMPKSTFDGRRQRACAYYRVMNNLVEDAQPSQPDLLFSFMGSRSHPIRDQFFSLSHPRAYIEDTTQVNFFAPSKEPEHLANVEKQKKAFVDTLNRSKFIICPRGNGPSSIRLFETLAMGRVPVIVSDEWVAPNGPQWEDFTVRVEEREISKVPQILEALEDSFPEMARKARLAYEEWFAPDVMFHRLIENCQEILQSQDRPAQTNWHLFDVQYLRCSFVNNKSKLRNGVAPLRKIARKSLQGLKR